MDKASLHTFIYKGDVGWVGSSSMWQSVHVGLHAAKRMRPYAAQVLFECWLSNQILILNVSWAHSYVYLELPISDRITQDAC